MTDVTAKYKANEVALGTIKTTSTPIKVALMHSIWMFESLNFTYDIGSHRAKNCTMLSMGMDLEEKKLLFKKKIMNLEEIWNA